MKNSSIYIILLTLGILIFLGGFVWVQVSRAGIGNLQLYQGSAEIIRGGKTETGQTGLGIRQNDVIKTGSGTKAAIILKDSSVIRLDENSEIEVKNISYQGKQIKDAAFKLKVGRLWSRAAPIIEGGQFEVETPTVVASIRGTSFNTTYNSQFSGIYVYRKKVNVLLKDGGNQQVLEGFLLRMRNDALKEDFEKGSVVPPNDYLDEWILFNQSEDDKICQDNPNTPGCLDYTFSTPSHTPTPSPTATPKPTLSLTVTPTPTPTPVPKKLVKFEITHDNTQNDCYPSCQFSGWAYFDDNPANSVDVTKNTIWSIQEPAKGTITQSGFYSSGKSRGDIVVGSYGNMNATHYIPPQVL